MGQGFWATIPWIAILDARETSKPSEGVYVVYLFRADMSGVYLTLSQGASSLMIGKGRVQLRGRARALRTRCKALSQYGFDVQAGLDLQSGAPLARGYGDSTIAYKLYAQGAIPSDPALIDDLGRVVASYKTLVPSRRFIRMAEDES
jgi:5-methylcytosine-specific restriction protein A